MSTRWFFVADARRHGPVAFERLIEALLSRPAAENALVWHPGLPDWVKASSVPEIVAELPPPLPGDTDFRLVEREEAPVLATVDDGSGEEAPPIPDGEKRPRRRHKGRDDVAASTRLREMLLPVLITLVMLLVLAFLLWKMFEVGEQLG